MSQNRTVTLLSLAKAGAASIGKDSHIMPSPCTRQPGFTLIELMIAVAIAGVLLAMGLPSMKTLMQDSRVKTAASETHLSLLLARSEAIKRSANIDLSRNTNWSNGWNVQVQSDSTVLRTQDPLSDVTVTCSTDSDATAEACPATVTFTRTGRPSSYIEFRLSATDNNKVFTRCVSISLSGRPRVKVDSDRDSTNGC
ncbi:MAG: GspH/FimT family pseudopilin [Gammaproteobacteria bacterium]